MKRSAGWEARLEAVCAESHTTHALNPLRELVLALLDEPDPPTTIREPAGIVDEHIADSLVGLERITGSRMADLGSGAGFPGLALAAALPEVRVDLVESSGRKAEVIERLAARGDLGNAHVARARAEDWATHHRCEYDTVTARALGPAAVILEYAAPLLANGGTAILWKGARDPAEETAAQQAADVLGLEHEQTVEVKPFPRAHSRHLHVYRKTTETPDRYPRRAGMATKRPLGRQ